VNHAATTSLLREASFNKYWISRMFSTTSFQMLSVAIGWQMYALTHSAFSLGFVGLAQFVPMVVLTLIVGHVADRFDRRLIVFLCQIIESLIAAGMLAQTLLGSLTQEKILLAAAVIGACRAFEGPSSAALLPQLVQREAIPQAIAWSTSAGQVAQILGPALGGVLYSVGSVVVYGTSAAVLLVAGVLTIFIRMEQVIRELRGVSLKSLFSGLDFVLHHPMILGTISLDLFAVLLGGATALLPIFAQTILHTGPWGLGLMRTAPAVGALMMSLSLASFPLKKSFGWVLFGALGVFGIATMVFAVSKSFVLSMVALVIVGASDMISVFIRSSLVQLQTPDEMRGRVNAVNSLFIGTSNQLGEFESGMVAGFMGAVPAAFFGGLGTIVIGALWMYLFPSLRKIRSLSRE